MEMAFSPQVALLVTQVMTALLILIPVEVGLFIITKALGERVEIKLLIGEGILAAICLELLFTFVKAMVGMPPPVEIATPTPTPTGDTCTP